MKRDAHMTGLAEGVSRGDEQAGTGETGGQLRAGQGGMCDPQEVGLAVAELKAASPQRISQTHALLLDRLHAPLDDLRACAQRLECTCMGDLGDPEVRREFTEELVEPGPPIA